jgi:hypothetical protein
MGELIFQITTDISLLSDGELDIPNQPLLMASSYTLEAKTHPQ